MNRSDTLWADAWFDEGNDTIKVKVCIRGQQYGKAYKKGLILRLTEEQLLYVSEAEAYKIKNIMHDNHLVGIVDEVIDEED